MKVTVLGKSPSWQDADGACSGYLVEDGDTCVLVDCGSGVFSKLRGACDYAAVDAIVITHIHADHCLDLVPYAYALTYGPCAEAVRSPEDGTVRGPRLLVPPGGAARLQTLTGAVGHARLLDDAFAIAEYDPAREVRVGTVHVRFQPVPHYVPTHAVELRDAGGRRFTYGADHGPTDALDAFAAQTDLLFLEATLPVPDDDGPRGHLTAAEAGEHAARCRARRLVLTHISDELDGERALAAARRAYDGPVELARGGAVYDV
ncbi:MAG: MBL fold metallo-hydrolase [Solirubrobacteraceae bacterium]|nr:MBL fold metallo-hydrolase [Solirubrobacteraceae bacterium]